MPLQLNALAVEPWHFSIFYVGSSPFILTICFLLGLAAYLGFMFGRNTRLFALLSLLFQVSLANRNIYPGFCTDIYSALLIWFIVFPNRQTVRGWPLYGYLFQLGLIYTASGLSKITPGSEWLDGTALSEVARYTNITNSLGQWLGHLPNWMQHALTFSSLSMEILALPLLLLPWTRNWIISVLISFHLITLATMNLGELPVLMIGALLVGFRIKPKFEGAAGPETEAPVNKEKPRTDWKKWFHSAAPAYVLFTLALVAIISQDVYNRVFWPTLLKWKVEAKPMPVPVPVQYFTGLVRIRQTWSMFASPLPKTLVWPVIACTTKGGRQFNFINGEPLNWQTPDNLAYYYDHRLYKYYNALYGFYAEGKTNLVNACGEFLVRDWNQRYPEDTLQHIGIWFGFAPTTNATNASWVKIY